MRNLFLAAVAALALNIAAVPAYAYDFHGGNNPTSDAYLA